MEQKAFLILPNILLLIFVGKKIGEKVNLESVTNIPPSFLDAENGKFLK